MAKPVIVKREVKGTPLTYTELDTNFQNLQDATVGLQAGTAGTLVTSDLNSFITLVAGSGIVLSGNNSTKSINISTTESQNIFQNIAVAGQTTVSADTTSDTLTLVAGTNVTITTNDSTDTITINSLGGDLVNDTSPQLGGNLDTNGFSIVTVSNGDLTLAPNGTGDVLLQADVFVGRTNTDVQISSNGTADLIFTTNNNVNSGNIRMNAGVNSDIEITTNGTGAVVMPGLTAFAYDSGINRSKIFSQQRLQIGGYTTTDPAVLEIGEAQFQFSDGTTTGLIIDANTATLTTNSGDFTITGASNYDVILDPVGTGRVLLSATTTVISSGSAGGLITTPGVGGITIRPNTNTGAEITVQGSSTAGNVTLTPSGTGSINLAGPVQIVSATTGTPTTYENGYYEDMLQTPVSWFKITIGGSTYYLPLFQ
jgi:hypothetical protein